MTNKYIVLWLFGTCFLIWMMIMLGGATRLTHAGLSIVEWKPIVGIIPPLTEAAWAQEFAKYQQFPEYQLVNQGMTVSEFKFIFFMEYTHRLLGRLMGLFFFLPLVFFWVRGQLSTTIKKRMFLVALLGMAQGVMGWYMVKSGLVKDPAVSHYRLTAHLLLALALLGLLFWTALGYVNPGMKKAKDRDKQTFIWIHVSATLIFLTITYGALVAGLKAGKIYNTYPLMGGQFLPSEWNFMSPLAINFVENHAMVQWIHRTLAIVTLAAVLKSMAGVIRGQFSTQAKQAAYLMVAAITLQVALGITTLLYEVPVSLGTLHQGTAAVVFTMILYMMFVTSRSERR